MPVIEGADLTSVDTTRQPLPEIDSGYLVTVKESEISADKRTLILKMRIDEPTQDPPREFWDYINLVQNDGKQNRISLEQIKRYLEAVFGKGSPEAESSPPDTDVLNGHMVRLYLIVDEYKDTKPGSPTFGEVKKNNKVKKIFPA